MRGVTTVPIPSGRSSCSSNSNVMLLPIFLVLILATSLAGTDAFAPPASYSSRAVARSSSLRMALDPVTYLRTEWVSAALVTNQTPRSADKILELGCEDGRIVNFVPRTIRSVHLFVCVYSRVALGGMAASLLFCCC